jgi:hypothetical protein
MPCSVRNISKHDIRQPISARILRNNFPDNVRNVAATISGANLGWILSTSHGSSYHEAVLPLLPLVCLSMSTRRASVQRFTRPTFPLQLLDRARDPAPDRGTLILHSDVIDARLRGSQADGGKVVVADAAGRASRLSESFIDKKPMPGSRASGPRRGAADRAGGALPPRTQRRDAARLRAQLRAPPLGADPWTYAGAESRFLGMTRWTICCGKRRAPRSWISPAGVDWRRQAPAPAPI